MAWIIIKSAGDDYSFVATKVEGKTGHTLQFAENMAANVTKAMKYYQENHIVKEEDCTCSAYQLETHGCNCGNKPS